MSYDRSLLFSDFARRLQHTPSKSLDRLSREMGVGRRTLQNALAKFSGKRFKDFQRDVLLFVIRDHLSRQPTLTVKEMAYCVGYPSPRSFTRAIKKACGMSPLELRSSLAAGLILSETNDINPVSS